MENYITLQQASAILHMSLASVKAYAKKNRKGLKLAYTLDRRGERVTTKEWVHEFLYDLARSSTHAVNKVPDGYVTPATCTPINYSMEDYFRASEVARELGFSRQRVHLLIQNGYLASVNHPYFGKVIHKDEMLRYRDKEINC